MIDTGVFDIMLFLALPVCTNPANAARFEGTWYRYNADLRTDACRLTGNLV